MLKVVPDSSFYICFLDDIEKPEYLILLLQEESFCYITGRIVKEEISKSKNYHKVKDIIESSTTEFEYYNYGEILRPFFSIRELKKGEHEVIVISYIFYNLGLPFTAIIDENGPRRFVKMNFPWLYPFFTGTVGFLKKCCCEYHVLTKERVINILDMIGKSKFRIRKEILNKVRNEVLRC